MNYGQIVLLWLLVMIIKTRIRLPGRGIVIWKRLPKSWNNTIPIPRRVAVCPICSDKIYAEFNEWQKIGNYWVPVNISLNCLSEPDFDDPGYDDWLSGHYNMPYVDWLPLTMKVEKILQRNIRIVYKSMDSSKVTVDQFYKNP